MKKTALVSAITVAMGVSNVASASGHLWDFSGTFSFYNAVDIFVPTVDTDGDTVADSPDTAVYGEFDLAAGTGSFDSPNTFNGYLWHADVDTMFQHSTLGGGTSTAPESFTWTWTNRTFDDGSFTILESCRTGLTLNGCAALEADTTLFELGGGVTNSYSFDLGPGQFAGGVFFDWSTNDDIPVLAALQVTNDPSVDGFMTVISANPDGGAPGVAMKTDPFPGQTPAFQGTLTPQVIPVPAAVWLFGSGLIGLVGVARRKKV